MTRGPIEQKSTNILDTMSAESREAGSLGMLTIWYAGEGWRQQLGIMPHCEHAAIEEGGQACEHLSDVFRQHPQSIDDLIAAGTQPDRVLAQRERHHGQRYHLQQVHSALTFFR